jgi:LmbE family N-acetylglucosaminyl deacetylase
MPRTKLFSGPGDKRIARALCIVAHPDDIEFYCAGSVAQMTERGVAVDFVVATSGDKGTRDERQTRAQLAAMREREQKAAAKILGALNVTFLGLPDAELEENLELRQVFVREIRRSRPDVVLTFDPTPGYRQHPDHRVVGRVTLDAAWPSARDPLTFPKAGRPHNTAEAWCFAGPNPNLEVDVSAHLEIKIRARLAHASQTPSSAGLRARWRHIAKVERFHQVDLR